MNGPTERVPEERGLDQHGYILLATLVAIGAFSLVVLALLDSVNTDTATTSGFDTTARVRRAADGALQLAADKLKVTPAAQLSATDPCAGLTATSLSIEGRDVAVTCSPVGGGVPMLPASPPNTPVLTLLGNYDGTLPQGVTNPMSGAMSQWVSDASTALSQAILNGPGLIHSAGEGLRIVGDAKVRQSTLAAVLPASYPAVDVTGTYQQGDLGPLGGANLLFFTTPPCGLLSDNPSSYESGLRVRASGGPTCYAGARDLVTPAAGPSVTAPASWTTSDVAAHPATMPTCPAGAKLVTFSPGAYNYVQVATMNAWFQNGNCDNVTFWFRPGDYYFDAAGSFGDDVSSLIFNDSTSNWVFGAPQGWASPDPAPASAFPEACDRGQQGVSLTLSSRTALKHKAGRVAVCGRRSGGTDLPAIYQQAGASNQTWMGEPNATAAPPASAGLVTFSPATVNNITASIVDPSPPAGGYPALGNAYDTSEAQRQSATIAQNCTVFCAVGVKLSGFSEPNELAPPGNLSSAVVYVRGTAYAKPATYDVLSGNPTGTETQVVVNFNDGSGGSCSVQVGEVPRSMTTPFAIDLLTNAPHTVNSCRGVLHSATQLDNATITMYFGIVPNDATNCHWVLIFYVCDTPSYATINVDYVWVQTTTAKVAAAPYATVVQPDVGTSMNVYGPVYVPNSQIEVRWQGAVNSEPLFVGGIVARGLYSLGTAGSHVGVLTSKTLAPGSRHVLLRAVTGGNLVGTATVLVNDTDTAGLAQDPGRELTVEDWQYCKKDASATSC
ncbi:MAG: hypothetical protein U0Q22_03220 [Acidimicrobiales bacterium]